MSRKTDRAEIARMRTHRPMRDYSSMVQREAPARRYARALEERARFTADTIAPTETALEYATRKDAGR